MTSVFIKFLGSSGVSHISISEFLTQVTQLGLITSTVLLSSKLSILFPDLVMVLMSTLLAASVILTVVKALQNEQPENPRQSTFISSPAFVTVL